MKDIKVNSCIYCGYKQLYRVSPTQYKCKKCLKKFSYKKLQLDFEIIELFCKNYSAKECSEILHVNYKTVQDRYMDFRKLVILYLENRYSKSANEFNEYDEYYYLPKRKRGKVKYLFEAIGVLGMVYENFVYTLMLPDQFSHLEQYSDENEVNIAYLKEYSRFLNRHKIVHYKKFDNLLIDFWVFLEESMSRFKGVSKENFIYYLKELEFKFNYQEKKQTEILWDLWLKSYSSQSNLRAS